MTLSEELDRRVWAAEADYRRRIAAVVWDPNHPEPQIASVIVDRQLEAEAVARATGGSR